MYHSVWKLTALAVVVAVGVAVVVHAQRGMNDDDDSADPELAATLGSEGQLAGASDAADEIPLQGEPDVAVDDEMSSDAAPAAPKILRTGKRDSAVGAPDSSPTLNDAGFDDEPEKGIRKTAAIERDPFAIDIVDVEDKADDGRAFDSGKSGARALAKKSLSKTTRGPVLTLDDADDASEKLRSDGTVSGKAKSRLLGASDESPSQEEPAATDTDDPFDDAEESPAAASKRQIASDSADLEKVDADDRDDSPPEKLPQAPVNARPPSIARDRLADRQTSDDAETPQIEQSEPSRKSAGVIVPVPKAISEADDDDDSLNLSAKPDSPSAARETIETEHPTTLSRTIEPDDSDDDRRTSEPRGRSLPRDNSSDEPPRSLHAAPESASGAPAFPQSNDTPDDEQVPLNKPQLPQMAIEKVAPPTAVLGQPMVYHIHVRNIGTIPTHQVIVEDIVPQNVKVDGSIPQATLKGNRLIWKLGTLAAGHERKISVRVIPQAEETIGSVATVNFSPATKPLADANAPQLKFEISSPRKASVGLPVEFSFRVKNVGRVPARGVTIRDVLPAGLRHPGGDLLEYEIGQISPGKTQEVKLTLIAAQAGPTVNHVVVTADGNVSEEAQVELEVLGPTLSVVRSGPKKLSPQKIGKYSNTVANPGASQISDVKVVEVVPAGMEFVDAGDGGTYNATKRTVTWTVNQLVPGESKTVKLSLRSVARDAQVSIVRAYDAAGASGETIGTTHVSGVPGLRIEMGDLPTLVEVGDTVTLPVRVVNRGSDMAANVRATVAVPAGMQFLSAKGPVEYHKVVVAAEEAGQAASTEVQFSPIGKIEPQADAVFELTFKARDAGEVRVEVQARCDQLAKPVRREEVITVATPE